MPWPVTSPRVTIRRPSGRVFPVVIIAAGLIGRLVPPRDGVSGDVRRLPRQQRLLNVAGDLEIVLNPVELTFGFGFTDGSFNVLADFAGDGTSNKSSNQKNDGVQADVGLRDGSGRAGNRRYSQDGQRQANRKRFGATGEPANIGVEAKDGKKNKNKK